MGSSALADRKGRVEHLPNPAYCDSAFVCGEESIVFVRGFPQAGSAMKTGILRDVRPWYSL